MDAEEFKTAANQLINYCADYLENIRDRPVPPNVTPGYLRSLTPSEAPEEGESWDKIFPDIEKCIMPGTTHWHSPYFHAYYPTANSWPAILGDILSGTIGCIGFSWMASPACTELEIITLDWLGKLLNLPEEFLAGAGKGGGGVIQGTASEALLVALLAARTKTLRSLGGDKYFNDNTRKLVGYTSDQAHTAALRAGQLAGIPVRCLETDDNCALRGSTLSKAIQEDKAKGLVPFFVSASLGTTSTCAFDDLREIGTICEKENLWLHVDAAYAGAAFICEEYRHYMEGILFADSFNMNPHKWLLVNFDCSALWLKNAADIIDAFNVDPVFLQHRFQGTATDYRHWQIPLGRRFRALKLWFVMRSYGAQGLRNYIREQVNLAKKFHKMVLKDDRFEVPVPPVLGLVCFRVKGDNSVSETLLSKINGAGKLHMVGTLHRDKFIIRFAVCSRYTEISDVEKSWEEICSHLEGLNTTP